MFRNSLLGSKGWEIIENRSSFLQVFVFNSLAVAAGIYTGLAFIFLLASIVNLTLLFSLRRSVAIAFSYAYLSCLGLHLIFYVFSSLTSEILGLSLGLFSFISLLLLAVLTTYKYQFSQKAKRSMHRNGMNGKAVVAIALMPMLILSLAVLLGDSLFDGQLSWAMLGDSRNHIDVSNDILLDNGIKYFGYPSFPDSLVASSLNWSQVIGQSTFESQVFVYSRFLMLAMFLLSALTASLFLSLKKGAVEKIEYIPLVVAFSIPMLPFWFDNAFSNGFYPSILSVGILLALTTLVMDDENSPTKNAITLISCFVVYMSYSLLTPIALALMVVVVLSYLKVSWKRIIFTIPICVAVALVSLQKISIPELLTSSLMAEGRTNEVNDLLLPLLIAAIIIWVFVQRQFFIGRGEISLGLISIVVSALFISVSLYTYLDGSSYYLQKTNWMLISLLSIVTCVIFSLRFTKLSALFVTAIFLANLFQGGDKNEEPISIMNFANGDFMLTSSATDSVFFANNNSDGSISWNTYGIEEQQLLNLWLVQEVPRSNPLHYWPYSGNGSSLSEICKAASTYPGATIWVGSDSLVDYVAMVCDNNQLKVRSFEVRK